MIVIPTQKPTQLPSTKAPTEKLTENTSIQDICTYTNFLNNLCTFAELNSDESYTKIKEELIQTYPSNGESLIIETNSNSTFQVTTTSNENDALKEQNGLSIIDLGTCEQTLKE